MPKVTTKLQVTVPKAIADAYRIKPGDEILWVSAGDTIRVIPPTKKPSVRTAAARLRLFDQATERQRARQMDIAPGVERDRGWTREELYTRGGSR